MRTFLVGFGIYSIGVMRDHMSRGYGDGGMGDFITALLVIGTGVAIIQDGKELLK